VGYGISRMPSRIQRIKTERVLEDVESGDDDENDKEVLDDFEFID